MTCATVWELTAYTNGHVFLTGCFSGELHLPIRQLGVSYGLISLAELPPPIRLSRSLARSLMSYHGESSALPPSAARSDGGLLPAANV